jgi:hypothetical protein
LDGLGPAQAKSVMARITPPKPEESAFSRAPKILAKSLKIPGVELKFDTSCAQFPMLQLPLRKDAIEATLKLGTLSDQGFSLISSLPPKSVDFELLGANNPGEVEKYLGKIIDTIVELLNNSDLRRQLIMSSIKSRLRNTDISKLFVRRDGDQFVIDGWKELDPRLRATDLSLDLEAIGLYTRLFLTTTDCQSNLLEGTFAARSKAILAIQAISISAVRISKYSQHADGDHFFGLISSPCGQSNPRGTPKAGKVNRPPG